MMVTTGTAVSREVDQQKVSAFAARLLGLYSGGMLSLLLELGYKTGLLEALALGPGTSDALAERSGLQERYVRELLNGLTAAGILSYEAGVRTYTLPPEHAVCLTGDSARNLAPLSQLISTLAAPLPLVAACFREGGGVPYSAYHPAFTKFLADIYRASTTTT
jgi:hypothetical protein